MCLQMSAPKNYVKTAKPFIFTVPLPDGRKFRSRYEFGASMTRGQRIAHAKTLIALMRAVNPAQKIHPSNIV